MNHVATALPATPASDIQGEQVGMKKAGIDLLVMPCLLNDKLSPWMARSVEHCAVW